MAGMVLKEQEEYGKNSATSRRIMARIVPREQEEYGNNCGKGAGVWKVWC